MMCCPKVVAVVRPLLALLSIAAARAASAQVSAPSGGGIRGFYVVPSLTTRLEITNNANLSATDKQSDVILGVTPAIQISGQSGRIRGTLNYALTASFSANGGAGTRFYNSLRGVVDAELVENRVFINASASISQQFIDPFGTQSPDASLNNSNRTEVTTVYVSPYTRGQIAGQVNYLGRAFFSYTDSGTSSASNSGTWGGLLNFNSSTRWAKLGWALDISYREANFTNGRTTFDQLNVASLNYAVTPALQVSLRGNIETSNVVSFDSETTTGWGGGLRWNPSPRTTLLLEYDQRIFGSSHLYSFDYRARRSVWSISSRQGLSTGQRNAGDVGPATAYDLLFAVFAPLEPDPIKREQLVNAFLQTNGIDPNAALNTGYLPSQVQLRNTNEASVGLLGIRSTLIFNVYQTTTQNLGPLSLPDNDFAHGNEITWVGFGVTWSRRLSPRSTFSLNARQQNTSQPETERDTTLRTATAIWTYQVAERATLSARARYAVQSGTSQYSEAALLGVLTMRF
jgi:uncharacterized protein (PEP-CTERM system associated)